MTDKWEYLITKEYKLRQHICEYFVSHLNLILDVGAYKTSLFHSGHPGIIPIDPLKTMVESYHGTVGDWVKEHGDLLYQDYAVIGLGLEIEGDEDEFYTFFNLVEGSKIAIIEFSKDHQPSVQQVSYILKHSSKSIKMEMDIQFPNVEVSGFKPHANRKLIILER